MRRWTSHRQSWLLTTAILCGHMLARGYCHESKAWRPTGPLVTTAGWTSCAVSLQGTLGCFDVGTDDGSDTPTPGEMYRLPRDLAVGGNVRSVSILSYGRQKWSWVANRVCVLTTSNNAHCFLVEGQGPQQVASLSHDVTSSLLPPEASDGTTAQLCTSTNYACLVSAEGAMSCGSTAMYFGPQEKSSDKSSGESSNGSSHELADGSSDGSPGGDGGGEWSMRWGGNATTDEWAAALEDNPSRFVALGPFLRAEQVTIATCGERQVCAIIGPHKEHEAGDWAGELHCWALQYQGDTYPDVYDTTSVVEAARKLELPPTIADQADVQRIATSHAVSCLINRTSHLLCWAMEEGMRAVVPPQLISDVTEVSIDGFYNIVCILTRNHDLNCFDPHDGDLYTLPPAATRDVLSVHVREGWLCSLSKTLDLRCFYAPLNTEPLVPLDFRTGVVSVTVGPFHMCVLGSATAVASVHSKFSGSDVGRGRVGGEGELRCYGYDDYGQATEPNNLRNETVMSVCTGYYHTCAVVRGGRVVCFGEEDDKAVMVPQHLQDAAFRTVACGELHTCGILEETGRLECWGADAVASAVDIPDDIRQTPMASVSAGGAHTCAISEAGTLWCWGNNEHKQCGPIPEGFQTGASLVSAGHMHTCVVNKHSELACFGWNYFSQCEILSGFSSGISSVAAGYGHTCAITSTRNLRCFGGPKDAGLADRISPEVSAVATGGSRICSIHMGELDCDLNEYFTPVPEPFKNLAAVDVIRASQSLLLIDPRNPDAALPLDFFG